MRTLRYLLKKLGSLGTGKPKEYKVPEDFDWVFYLEHYPDLGVGGIHTKQQAKKHWVEYGQFEGRIYKGLRRQTRNKVPLREKKASLPSEAITTIDNAVLDTAYWNASTLPLNRERKGLIYHHLSSGYYVLKGDVHCQDRNSLSSRAWLANIISDSNVSSDIAMKMKLLYSETLGPFKYLGSKSENFYLEFFLPYDAKRLEIFFRVWNYNHRISLSKINLVRSENADPEITLIKSEILKLKFLREIEEQKRRSIILYGDINLNIVDGSSIWLNSVTNLISHYDIDVFLLLKSNIRRDILTRDLKTKKNVHLLSLDSLGSTKEELTPAMASDIIEFLDGVLGGFEAIILRGFRISQEVSTKGRLSRRIWCYLTDFYSIDRRSGRNLDACVIKEIADIAYNAEYFLVQTAQLGNELTQKFLIDNRKIKRLPPILPSQIINALKEPISVDKSFSGAKKKIVYAGKLAPQWGILELFKVFDKLQQANSEVELHIIGDKIHENSEEHPRFHDVVISYLDTKDSVIWHKGLSRQDTIRLLNEMDIGWAYREIHFEKNTLELSTKLLEYLACGLPTIVARNSINEELLGKDYPYFIDKEEQIFLQLQRMIHSSSSPQLSASISDHVIEEHLADNIRLNYIDPLIEENSTPGHRKHFMIASNDFRFIDHFESFLRRNQHTVVRDEWEWGAPKDLEQSKASASQADIIFCEWALANAVWYSNNKGENQKLFIRLHSQEVMERARKFGEKINIDAVDKVIFVSENVLERAKTLWGWPDSKLCVIPNYVHCNNLNRPKSEASTYNIGMVGIVPKSKRFDRALDLLELLRKSDSRYNLFVKGKLPQELPWMYGPSRKQELDYYEAEFERIKKSRWLQKAIHFDGFGKDMAEWYRKINVIISPSDFESFHYGLADGAASGSLPIIWPWEGAQIHYPADWVVDNTEEAVEKILAFNQLSPSERTIRSDQFHKVVAERNDCEKIYEKLYQTVVNSHFRCQI